MRLLIVLLVGLASNPALAQGGSVFKACLQALTGARAYRPLDVRGWKGLEEPSPYAGLITPQWDEWGEPLTVEGTWPTGLNGTYLRMGPLGFDSRGGQRKRSVIDSAGGLLRRYRLDGDRPTVDVRRVETDTLRAEVEAGEFLFPSISTLVPGRPNGAARMRNQASVAVYPRAGNYVVTDEMQRPIEMRKGDLATLGEVTLDASTPDAKYLAHAKRDPRSGRWCHVEFAMSGKARGRVVCLDDAGQVDWRSGYFEVPANRPGKSSLIHDWALTQDYVVLYLHSYVLHLPGLLKAFAGMAPMMDALVADPKLEAKVALFSREDGALKALVDTGEAALTWHFVNAYQVGDEVTLDLTSTKIEQIERGLGESMRFVMLGKPLPDRPSRCFLKRLRVNAATATKIENEVLLDDANYEFPAVAPRVSGHPHRYGYLGRCHGAEPWFTGVAKYDYDTRTVTRFDFAAHEFAGEPMFAPRTGGVDEDDGFVLVEVYDGQKKKTALVVFDARDLAAGPVARLWLSRHLPFGFHGLWVE